jgi:hypothetical protein
MKPHHAIGSLALLLGLTTGFAGVCWTQQPSAPAISPTDSGLVTEDEERAFDARRRAASDEMRARIERERADLIQVRIMQRDLVQIIPPSRSELSDDPVMPAVPTPPLERPWMPATPSGGAIAPTGSGTSPARSPGSYPSGQEWR